MVVVDQLYHMYAHLEVFQCPQCGGELRVGDGQEIQCQQCHTSYPVQDGIPQLFVFHDRDSSDVTEKIKAFYEETPFPNYEELETAGDLMQKAEQGFFARMLNAQLPYNIRVLEVGCGTGQMSNYLGLSQRIVFGTDMCLNSLRLAHDFKTRHAIERAGFYQMNLFRPIFKPASFHLVICNGVLHHTADPYGGFVSIAKLVKPGGYILIGLYNKYGRLITDIRRQVFRFFHDRFTFLDPQLRQVSAVGKWNAWFKDQYKNPHESKHTIGEVLHWFDKTGFDFMCGIPNPKAFQNFSEEDRMFTPHPRGTFLDHAIVQAKLMLKGSREGGFYIMIGRKRH